MRFLHPNLLQHKQHMYMAYPAVGQIVPDIDDLLQPLENAIHQRLIPVLTG